MEDLIFELIIFHFILTIIGYSFLIWKIKFNLRKLKYLYEIVIIFPLFSSSLNLIINLPISSESIVNFLILYFSGAIGGSLALLIIEKLEKTKKRNYKFKKIRRKY